MNRDGCEKWYKKAWEYTEVLWATKMLPYIAGASFYELYKCWDAANIYIDACAVLFETFHQFGQVMAKYTSPRPRLHNYKKECVRI